MNVVAINKASAEEVERVQKEVMKDEFKTFIQNDPEVRAMMIERVKQIIGGLSNWDIEYHSAFKEVAGDIIRTDAVKPLFEEVIKRVLTDEKTPDYRIIEAMAEYLAGRIELKVQS
jgi:hypothetical protein